MPVPDRAFARVGGHLEILGQFKAIGGTGVFAQTAEHASGSIVGERSEHFATRSVVAMPADDDQIFRAGQGTEIAGDTKGFAGLRVHIQARRPAVPFRHHRALLRILLSINIFRVLRTEGQEQALPKIRQKQPTQECIHGA